MRPIIKGLIPVLSERGKIKIGMKGNKTQSSKGTVFQLPQKIDHFLVTTLERDQNDNFIKDSEIHSEIGENPKKIPIRLLYDDISLNFQCRYCCYYGRTMFCHGDGETAQQTVDSKTMAKQAVECPCERQDPTYKGDDGNGRGKCKINGSLSVIVDCKKATVGGVWRFRTTGYNSTVGILGSLQLISATTGGLLAGIPLEMVITPKITTDPSGKPVTIYIVGVQYPGSFEQLRQVSLNTAQDIANHRQRMHAIEETAKTMIVYEQNLIEESGDIVEEFHPEEVIEEIEAPEAVSKPEPAPAPTPEQPPKKAKRTAPKKAKSAVPTAAEVVKEELEAEQDEEEQAQAQEIDDEITENELDFDF